MKGAKERQMEGKAIMWRVLKLGGPILALRYLRAAQRDESDGLTFTAAMEWRKAAELSSCITLLSNRYWREWERIMHLPRRLAEPIGLAPINAVAASSSLEISLSRSRAASRVYLRLHPGVQFRALIFRLLTVTADTVPDSRVAG
jgi:hypothetical protein